MNSAGNFEENEFIDTVRSFSGGQRVLNRYRLERVLGQGGMGVVWLARDEELDRNVALKFLPTIVVNDRASLNDLKRETKRSLELTHPNIVRTYDFVQDKTLAGISMEYVDGDTLRNRRIDQPNHVFEPGQLGEWMRQLCAGLDYAHREASIVHRDLKPANLMVNLKGQLRIADFGISRSLVDSVSQISAQRGASGTLVYMSPQQLCGDTASPSDDIYALGATLYELITSRPPFYSGDISGQVHGRAPSSLTERRVSFGIPPGSIPRTWEDTVAACLAKEPEKRPQSAGEVAARLGLPPSGMGTSSTSNFASSVENAETLPGGPMPPMPAQEQATAALSPFDLYQPPTVPLPATPHARPPKPRKSARAIGIVFAVLALLLGTAWYVGTSGTDSKDNLAPFPEQTVPKTATASDRNPSRLEPHAPMPVAEPHGSMVVKTEPTNASIKIGDAPSVQSPAALQDLKPGKYRLEISLDGYDPVVLDTVIQANQITDPGIVKLQRSAGALHVVSKPAGLAYEMRSKANPLQSVHGVTPLDAPEIPVGDYEITVSREGWLSQKQSVAVIRQQSQNTLFEFIGGGVAITSVPTGAKVLLGDKPLGVTPLHLTDLPPGEVTYTIAFAGYTTATVKGTVETGGDTALPVKLVKGTAKPIAKSGGNGNSQSGSGARKPSSDGDSGGGHNHTGEILRGIFGVPGYGPRFGPRPF